MLPPEPPLVCVRPPLLALVPPLLCELLALVPPVLPPLRLLEEAVEPPLWLLLRLPPAPPELVLDDPPPSLLLALPDEPPLDRDELAEPLLDEPPLLWLPPPEACVRPLIPPLPLPLLALEAPPDALCEPVSSLQPEAHAKRTERTAQTLMAISYFASSGTKPAGTCSVR